MNDLLIESVCRKVLNEYLGVSDEVTELGKSAFKLLLHCYDNTMWMKVRRDQGDVYQTKHKVYDFSNGNLSIMKISKIIDSFSITLYGYDPNEYTFEEYGETLGDLFSIAFTPNKNQIRLAIPYPLDGKLDEPTLSFIQSSINHEVEHAWQSYNRGGTNISDAYGKSLAKNDWNTDKDTAIPLLKYYIKQCYYALDSDEVDAKLQEIWYELSNNKDLKDTDGYKYMQEVIKGYQWVYDMIVTPDSFRKKHYQREISEFKNIVMGELGLNSPNQWFKYCQKGIRKFNGQLRRVVGRNSERLGYPSNGSFRNYSQNEIPQRDVFRRRDPSLWRRIINRISKFGKT